MVVFVEHADQIIVVQIGELFLRLEERLFLDSSEHYWGALLLLLLTLMAAAARQ